MVLAVLMQIAPLKHPSAPNGDFAKGSVPPIWIVQLIILFVQSGVSASVPLTSKEEQPLAGT